jgi:transposase InsO family protein
MAESINGLYKAECITLDGPWRSVEDVELATLAWVHWWNTTRILEPIGDIPPVEFEKMWREQQATSANGSPAGLVTQ